VRFSIAKNPGEGRPNSRVERVEPLEGIFRRRYVKRTYDITDSKGKSTILVPIPTICGICGPPVPRGGDTQPVVNAGRMKDKLGKQPPEA